MELLLNPGRVKKIRIQFVVYMSIISFLLSIVTIDQTSLLFVLPLFYLSFMCGYLALLCFTFGLLVGIVFLQVPYEVLLICLLSFVLLEFCQLFQSMKARYVPYLLTLIGGIFYAYIQIDLLSTLLLTILTYINTMIFIYLAPLFMHGDAKLLTHERLKTVCVLILICMMSLLSYSSFITLILMRIFILMMIYYDALDDVMPGLFYCAMLMLLMSMDYKDDILSMILPLFFFYMVKYKEKIGIGALYLLSHLILPFFLEFDYTYHGIMIISSVLIFAILPMKHTSSLLSSSYQEMTLKQQLSKQVDSFCQLFDEMTSLFSKASPHNHSLEYAGYIYEDLCSDCISNQTCFHKKYGPNRLVKLMNKGLQSHYNEQDKDFIDNYCLDPKKCYETIDSYQEGCRKVKRIQQEYTTMKKDLYHQFSLLNNVFHQFSNQLSYGHIEESHIISHMEGYHFQIAHLKKYYESQSIYYIEIGLYETNKDEVINEFIPILETYLNETLDIYSLKTPMNQLGYTYLVLKHQSRYYIQYGINQFVKDVSACGDSYTIFTMNENQYFALSDGMGQGQKASDDSTLSLNVVKQLITNGISLDNTIQSVNALLKIKNRNDMFTTLDMIEVNLVTGKATLVKYGACSTYILRDNEIIEIQLEGLPIGIVSPIDTKIEHYKLRENDLVFMISDGFTHHFKQFLNENKYPIEDDHPKEIVRTLCELACEEEHNDDMTMIVLKLCKQ